MDSDKNDGENVLGWSPMLEVDSSVDANKINELDLERKDHRYLHGLAQRIKGIESHWLALLEKNFAPEVMSQFSHLIRDESRLAEAHGFNAIFELTAEIESTLIAIGRNPGNYTDSIRAYMDSCVSTLNRTVTNLIDEALANMRATHHEASTNTGRHSAPRVYILDTQKDTAAELSIDLKGQGFKVFPIVDWSELERLSKLQKPAANLIILNEGEDLQPFLERLRAVITQDAGQVPCYVLCHDDTPQNRVMVATSGANSFIPLPCFVPSLAAQLHSLKHISLERPMSLLLVGEPGATETKKLVGQFTEAEADITYCEKLSQLPYLPKEKDIDAILVADTGDEKLITRCMALVGQDQTLMSLPMAVFLKSTSLYSEPLMRLISSTASEVFAPNVDRGALVMRLQSRTLQTRKKRFMDDYMKAIDPESGLLMRPAFYEEVEARSQNQSRNGVPHGMIYVRLDYLREISEALGIAQIGALKKKIAHRLISVLGPDDIVTMLSDNEYLIFASRDEAAAYRQVEWSVKKQIQQLGEDVVQNSKFCARIGIALLKDKDILKTVNAAIGAINLQVEAPTQAAEPAPVLTKRLSGSTNAKSPLTQRIKKAMEEDRLTLLFQPIVSMEGDGFERYEVLMRMREAGQTLSPAEFLTKDTPANVYRFLDRWVISKALKVMTKTVADRKELKFFIKLNSDTVSDDTFVDWLSRILKATDAPIERCVFELKEQTVINSFTESQAFINFVRDQGACVCIENFGGSPQSLKLLDYVEVDYLKLDKEYLGAIGTHDERDLRLDTIIDKANQLEVSTLAGFVETTSNLSLALQRGVALFQGYFLQPPQENMDFDFSVTM